MSPNRDLELGDGLRAGDLDRFVEDGVGCGSGGRGGGCIQTTEANLMDARIGGRRVPVLEPGDPARQPPAREAGRRPDDMILSRSSHRRPETC